MCTCVHQLLGGLLILLELGPSILSELKTQAVSDITNITIKDSSGGRKNTSTFIVTFKQTTIPQHIKIGYIRVPVRDVKFVFFSKFELRF